MFTAGLSPARGFILKAPADGPGVFGVATAGFGSPNNLNGLAAGVGPGPGFGTGFAAAGFGSGPGFGAGFAAAGFVSGPGFGVDVGSLDAGTSCFTLCFPLLRKRSLVCVRLRFP